MKSIVVTMLILLCVLMPFQASATMVAADLSVADSYETGMACFYLEDYSTAVAYFSQAGNYKDAKKWNYYCQAIDLILQDEPSIEKLEHAKIRFDLLAAHEFQDADQWATYCKARQFEAQKLQAAAEELYVTILVHDSIERYLACQNRSNLLNAVFVDEVRMKYASLPAVELYETAINFYYLEEYNYAADCFFLAGNYSDARKWRCFCTAISLIINHDQVSDAQILFDLLSRQNFPDAQAWLTYCKAREYENMQFTANAIELYKTAFVYDSSERYLNLLEQ